jgi:hypothetical protein
VLFAKASKSQIRNIAEMLGGLDCSKSYFLGLCQKLLSEKSPKSLKLSGFYKLSSGTSTYLGVVLNKCKRRLGKYFEVRDFALHRPSLWKESKTSERDFLAKSEAVASKFSRGGTLVLGSRWSKRGEDLKVFPVLPREKERGKAPKVHEELGLEHGLLYPKVPAGFQARSLAQKSSQMTFQAMSLRSEI